MSMISPCFKHFRRSASGRAGHARGSQRRKSSLSRSLRSYISPANAANCTVDGNCPAITPACRNGRCSRRVDVASGMATNGASYLKCEGAGLRNIVRFDGTSVPEPLSTVEVCYDVLPTFQNSCP